MLPRARTEWRDRLKSCWAEVRPLVGQALVLEVLLLSTLVPWTELSHSLVLPTPAVQAHVAAVVAVLCVYAWWASRVQRGATAAVWRMAAITLSMGALAAGMEAAQATVLRYDATAFVGARCVLFLACGWLALRAARAADALLRESLRHRLRHCGGALAAAGLGLGLLTAPFLPRAAGATGAELPLSTADEVVDGVAAGVDVRFMTHWSPHAAGPPLVRRGPLLAVSEGQTLLWVDPHGVRRVAPTDGFPATTHVLMDTHARVADFVAAADTAISRGANEVVWVLPHPAGVPSRLSHSERLRINAMLQRFAPPLDRRLAERRPQHGRAETLRGDTFEEEPAVEEPHAPRPSCTPLHYRLTDAMTGTVTRGPMTVRAVGHPNRATPGMPWTDELGPLDDLTLTDVLHRRRTVRLQRWSPPQAGHPIRALMLGALLVGLALGVALFALRLVFEAASAGRLAGARGVLPLAGAVLHSRGAVFPEWLPRARATHVVGSGSPYRAAPGVLTARAGVVVRVGLARLVLPGGVLVAVMLVLSGALLLAS